MKMTWAAVLIIDAGAPSTEEVGGPVAHYAFDEGKGSIAHDGSGHGHHGRIHGARFVRLAKGYALEFDGKDAHVDCGARPAFDVRHAYSIEFWMLDYGRIASGESGILGKSPSTYRVTQFMGKVYAYRGGGAANSVFAFPTPQSWRHIVITFEAKLLSVYVDGEISWPRPVERAGVGSEPAVPLFIGKVKGMSGGFCGLMDEVRFYDRALAAKEVGDHYRATGRGFGLVTRATFVPTGDRLVAQADLRHVPRLPDGTSVDVEVLTGERTVARARIAEIGGRSSVETYFDAMAWRPGKYAVRTSLVDAHAQPVVPPVTCSAALDRPVLGRTSEGYRRLNNFVAEIVNVRGAQAEHERRFRLANEGWVFLATTAHAPTGATLTVRLDRDACLAHAEGKPATQETMRYLPAGEHRITFQKAGAARIERLVVRRVPELAYHAFGAQAAAGGIDRYAAFLKRHVYPNVNLFVLHQSGSALDPSVDPRCQETIARWRRDGRKFCWQDFTTYIARDVKPLSGEGLYKRWTTQPGFGHPLTSGLYVSELCGGAYGDTPAWIDAIERLAANPALAGRKLYPYGYGFYANEPGRRLMGKLMEHGHVLSWERYLQEQPTESDAWFFLRQQLSADAEAHQRVIPGAMKATTVNLAIFSDLGDSLDWYPHVNLKTYFDMMLSVLANDPQFRDLHGIQWYAAIGTADPDFLVYANAETVRWLSRLFRHYGIEGHTGPCSDDPYVMTHLENGHFDRGTAGWQLSPATADSIRVERFKGLGWLEGVWPYGSSVGDTALAMTRSRDGPNRTSQQVRDLAPGRLYSVQMFSVDRREPKDTRPHGLVLRVDGADVLLERSFHRVRPNLHRDTGYPRGSVMLNCYRTVFRATAPSARLTISDWNRDGKPGGPVGRRLLMNFVQVQPFFEGRSAGS